METHNLPDLRALVPCPYWKLRALVIPCQITRQTLEIITCFRRWYLGFRTPVLAEFRTQCPGISGLRPEQISRCLDVGKAPIHPVGLMCAKCLKTNSRGYVYIYSHPQTHIKHVCTNFQPVPIWPNPTWHYSRNIKIRGLTFYPP